MVFYFTDNVVTPPITYFMGADKYENEELIKWGWPEDIWFHVDKLSSAHVYLRLNPGQTIDDLPPEIIENACQLCKANSIKGNKMNDIDIVYTMWSNLKKTPGMEPGQVSFFDDNQVKKFKVEKRKNEIINRLKKTMKEEHPDFRSLKESRDALEKQEKKRLLHEEKQKEKEAERKRKEEAELRSYATLMKPENMTSNYDQSGYDSDDFM